MPRDLYSAIMYFTYSEEVRLMQNLDTKYALLRRNPYDSNLMLEYIKAEIELQYFKRYMKSLFEMLMKFGE